MKKIDLKNLIQETIEEANDFDRDLDLTLKVKKIAKEYFDLYGDTLDKLSFLTGFMLGHSHSRTGDPYRPPWKGDEETT